MLELLEAPGPYGDAPPDGDRRCSRCGELKPMAEFRVKDQVRGTRAVWCRTCRLEYGREHYRRNRPAYLARARRRRQVERPRVRQLIDGYLRQHPCVDCGCRDITVLEFDHRDPRSKDVAVGQLARVAEWPRVLREIEKCDVRCANCHRRRTAAQFRWAKVDGLVLDTTAVRPGRAGRYARIETPQQDELFSAEPHGLRRCATCGELKPLFAFPFRYLQTGERQYYCRPCRAKYRRAHYERNKGDYVARAKVEMQMKREDSLIMVWEYLRGHPCVDCGETDIISLEFDHMDPRHKRLEIGSMVGHYSSAKIIAEMQKCEVRCANCHRKRTAVQRAWKYRLAEEASPYAKLMTSAGVA